MLPGFLFLVYGFWLGSRMRNLERETHKGYFLDLKLSICLAKVKPVLLNSVTR